MNLINVVTRHLKYSSFLARLKETVVKALTTIPFSSFNYKQVISSINYFYLLSDIKAEWQF